MIEALQPGLRTLSQVHIIALPSSFTHLLLDLIALLPSLELPLHAVLRSCKLALHLELDTKQVKKIKKTQNQSCEKEERKEVRME